MGHERSVTEKKGERWFNLFGPGNNSRQPAGTPLPGEPVHGYSTVEEAVEAAKRRSREQLGPERPSHLPKGVSETPKGDIGKHRQQEARELGTFKQVKDISTEFGSSVKPDQAMDESYHPHKGKEVQ